MLPASYQLPAAIVLLLGGTVACFFGYRMFRLVLAIFGFILGAFAASSSLGSSDTTDARGRSRRRPRWRWHTVRRLLRWRRALWCGIGALVANLAFSAGGREPHFLVIAFCAVAGAVLSMYLAALRHHLGTAFGGAWTMIVGAMALVGDRAALAAAVSGDVWVAYPLDPAPGRRWVPIAWIVLSLIGTGVQLGFTGGEKGRVGRKKPKTK